MIDLLTPNGLKVKEPETKTEDGTPRFSIVTISYNQGKYLEECINSVLSQSYKNFEYIVVDDGSTDNSREIILKYKNKLKYIFKKNTGPADSLNAGFNLANGEIFYYINSDDYILKDSLKIADELFHSNSKSDVIYGNGYIIDENSNLKKRMFSNHFSISRFKYVRAIICQQATFIRKEAFQEVNGFNITNDKSWDYEIFIDIYLNKKKFLKVNNFLGAFRIYPGTITFGGSDNIKIQDERMYLKYIKREKNSFDRFLIKLIYFFDRILNFKFWYFKVIDSYEASLKKKIT